MESFRSEIENPIVHKDIIELGKKIAAFRNNEIDEDRFRSLRLARGVYGQRQQGVQMVRIKLPLGKVTAKQLLRICDVSDEFSRGNLHITTRQDIQIHYVSLDRTPELWSELEKDSITLREACGNTVRNVTASIFAGVDVKEPFDATPYAYEFFQFFLRNPICQEMGRKFKIAFSSSEDDAGITFVHDLGFIPQVKDGVKGFKVLLGGGIGSQPQHAHLVYEFLEEDEVIPFSEAVVRVFDRYGERNKRNKARLKYLVSELGIDAFLQLVEKERVAISAQKHPIEYKEAEIVKPEIFTATLSAEDAQAFENWKRLNTIAQKQAGYVSVGIAIKNGDIRTDKTRLLAAIIEKYTGNDTRLTASQSILLRFVPEENLAALYLELKKLNLVQIGFHRVNDIVTCPGTDTCNLGIASSMGLGEKLKEVIESEFAELIEDEDLSIKISGCMNACGQHTIGNIGFQGMTIKSGKLIAPASQVLLGGGILGNGQGRFADKLLKVPSKRTPDVLRWILTDFSSNKKPNQNFLGYYDEKGSDYFYQALKHYGEVDNLQPDDFIDWGNEAAYEMAIGVGECAGVTIDLVATLLLEGEEKIERAEANLAENAFADGIYNAYASFVHAAKAILTTTKAKTNSHASIIESFDEFFPTFAEEFGKRFSEVVYQINQNQPSKAFAEAYLAEAKSVSQWIKALREKQLQEA